MMKKVVLSLALLLIVALVKAQVTYTVTVPAGTSSCYIAGDFNNWSFTTEMTNAGNNTFTVTISGAITGQQYKYCCGPDWAYVEVQSDGNDISNRTTINTSVPDVVAKWKAEPAGPSIDVFTIDYDANGGGDWPKEYFSPTDVPGEYSIDITFTNTTDPDYGLDRQFWVGYSPNGGTPSYGNMSRTETLYASLSESGLEIVASPISKYRIIVSAASTNPNYIVNIIPLFLTNIKDLSSSTTKVYTDNLSVIAQFEGAAAVELYTVSGVLLKKTVAVDSFEQTGLAPGLYIVKINGKASKVAVK
jgi:hypothetical protein